MTGVGTSSQPATGTPPDVASAAPSSAPSPSSPAPFSPSAWGWRPSDWWSSPPGRLRLVSLVVMVLLVALWITAFATSQARQGTLDALSGRPGGGQTATLVAALRLRSDLAGADAAATRARLGGNDGLEVARQREAYRRAMADVGVQLVVLARAHPHTDGGTDADLGPALTVIAQQLPPYGGEVAQAKAARSELMWRTILPAADRIVATEQSRAEHALHRAEATNPLVGVVVLGALTFGALVSTQIWLMRRTNRVLNPALAAATVLSAVAVGWTLLAFATQHDHIADGRDHGYRPLTRTSQARVLALRAWTDDVRALLDRSEAPRLDADSAAASTRLRHDPASAPAAGSDGSGLLATIAAPGGPDQAARAALTPAWTGYADIAARIRDGAGRPEGLWPAALLAQQDATGALRTFDERSVAVLDASRTHLTDDLTAATDTVDTLPAALSITLGLAAVLTFVGLQLRINDYR